MARSRSSTTATARSSASAGSASHCHRSAAAPCVVGWDWAEHAGDFEDVSGTKWGEFVVTGTFDGGSVTPVGGRARRGGGTTAPSHRTKIPSTTPCPEPDGGWVVDPATTTENAMDQASRVARRLPTFGELWVDHSINPVADEEPSGLEWEIAMSDPRYIILNVSVTDDLAGAEAAIREVWGGPLCISEAVIDRDDASSDRTGARGPPGRAQLGRGELSARGLGAVRRRFDPGLGRPGVRRGVVVISSALVPVDG